MTNLPHRLFKATLLCLCGTALFLAGCESIDEPSSVRRAPPIVIGERPEPGPVEPEPEPYDPDEYITGEELGVSEPVRVALLLPLSSESANVRTIAEAMSNAAQMAAFESRNERYLLIPKDTGGTPEGAQLKAEEALREGAEIVLGPLLSSSVEAAAEVTRRAGVPMIAFSSDTQIAGDGVYLLSFPPEMEIARITDYAISRGYTRFGLLSPLTEYGQRVRNSFHEEAYVRGAVVVHEEQYEPSPDAMMQPARRLSEYANECSNAEPGEQSAAMPGNETHRFDLTTGGYQAVLMPEQGTNLRALAPLLPYYNVNVRCIKVLGVSAWNNPLLTREPALNGGWFAAPDPTQSEGFKQRYASVYGDEPPRLASLAYDAALLTASLATNPPGQRFSIANITNPNGYLGADGLFRLTPDGRVERGLAILQLSPGGIRVIDPAPTSFVTQTSALIEGY